MAGFSPAEDSSRSERIDTIPDSNFDCQSST
jgi:hypothetical protein